MTDTSDDTNWDEIAKQEEDWKELVEAQIENLRSLKIEEPEQWKPNKYNLQDQVDSFKGQPSDLEAIKSGKLALVEHLRKLTIGKDHLGKDVEAHWRNKERVNELRAELLKRAYDGLHHQCPMKRLYNRTQFAIIWGDFDPRILVQIDQNPLKSENSPEHLVILAQGVYQENLFYQLEPVNNLKVYKGYICEESFDHHGNKKWWPEMEYLPQLVVRKPEQYQYVLPHLPESSREALVNIADSVIEQKALQEDKRVEKWKLYLDHDQWVKEYAPEDYKAVWEAEKDDCNKRLKRRNKTGTALNDIIWSYHYLHDLWLEEGYPILPTQKIVKLFMEEMAKEGEMDSRYAYQWTKDDWKKPLDQAKKWIIFPHGIRGDQKGLL